MGEPPPEILSAGAVLWRPARSPGPGGEDPAGPEVALVHRARYRDWTLPKGKREPGEHLLRTAVREVAEETGAVARLGRRLPSVRYQVEGRSKQVDFWAAPVEREGHFVPNAEVDELVWLPVGDALGRVSYPGDAQVLADFASGPAATSAVIILRHASAVSKTAWRAAGQSDDLPRPLTARGRAQANHLADLLTCYPSTRVVSSPAERCLATVRPYAARIGADVETAPFLRPDGPACAGPGSDAAHRFDPARGAAAAEAASARQALADLGAGHGPLLICGHRENLPTLLAWVCAGLGSPPPAGPSLRKGEFWALHVAQGGLTSSERHRPQGW